MTKNIFAGICLRLTERLRRFPKSFLARLCSLELSSKRLFGKRIFCGFSTMLYYFEEWLS
jgi:hypothetical protein